MTITEIFRAFGPEYLSRYPDMPLIHKKTFAAMVNCRSGMLGATFCVCKAIATLSIP